MDVDGQETVDWGLALAVVDCSSPMKPIWAERAPRECVRNEERRGSPPSRKRDPGGIKMFRWIDGQKVCKKTGTMRGGHGSSREGSCAVTGHGFEQYKANFDLDVYQEEVTGIQVQVLDGRQVVQVQVTV